MLLGVVEALMGVLEAPGVSWYCSWGVLLAGVTGAGVTTGVQGSVCALSMLMFAPGIDSRAVCILGVYNSETNIALNEQGESRGGTRLEARREGRGRKTGRKDTGGTGEGHERQEWEKEGHGR